MVNLIGDGEEADLTLSSVNKIARALHHVVVLKTKVLHFKLENTSIKDTNEKRKFKECSHSFL